MMWGKLILRPNTTWFTRILFSVSAVATSSEVPGKSPPLWARMIRRPGNEWKTLTISLWVNRNQQPWADKHPSINLVIGGSPKVQGINVCVNHITRDAVARFLDNPAQEMHVGRKLRPWLSPTSSGKWKQTMGSIETKAASMNSMIQQRCVKLRRDLKHPQAAGKRLVLHMDVKESKPAGPWRISRRKFGGPTVQKYIR